jgi:hypothetical protein
MKYIKGFFAFWYDFIVGDAWEVAAGVLVALLLLFVGTRVFGSSVSTVGVILFPVAIVALLMFSLWRVRRTG